MEIETDGEVCPVYVFRDFIWPGVHFCGHRKIILHYFFIKYWKQQQTQLPERHLSSNCPYFLTIPNQGRHAPIILEGAQSTHISTGAEWEQPIKLQQFFHP